MAALSRLAATRNVKVVSEYFDPNAFGGATSLGISVDGLRLEIDTRDPTEPYEVAVSCPATGRWARASNLKAYFHQSSDHNEAQLLAGLVDWLAQNFDAVDDLMAGPGPLFASSFLPYANNLDAERDARMMADFHPKSG